MCFVVQLIETQQAAMEWHEDLQNLAQQQGLKGKKLNKARNNRIHLAFSCNLQFRQYPAIHTNYIIFQSTTLQYNHNM